MLRRIKHLGIGRGNHFIGDSLIKFLRYRTELKAENVAGKRF